MLQVAGLARCYIISIIYAHIVVPKQKLYYTRDIPQSKLSKLKFKKDRRRQTLDV